MNWLSTDSITQESLNITGEFSDSEALQQVPHAGRFSPSARGEKDEEQELMCVHACEGEGSVCGLFPPLFRTSPSE